MIQEPATDAIKVQIIESIQPVQSTQTHPLSGPLRLFEDVPGAYEPLTGWLDGHAPVHPHFENAERIQFWTRNAKEPVLRYILEGCQILLERAQNQRLLLCLRQHELLWKAAVSLHKYGSIYFASRSECRDDFLSAVESNLRTFHEIDAFLSADKNAIRAINYGVHQLVRSGELIVEYHAKLIPPFGISAIGVNHVGGRRQDFDGDSMSLLDREDAIYDLHDFAHITAASLCPAIYGSKYFSHLMKLPPDLTVLIRSPKKDKVYPSPAYSDGLIFGELLPVLFKSEVEDRGKAHTYASLTEDMADSLADYLMGRRELEHLTTGQILRVKERMTAVELAVLVQNKVYELSANELEQKVLTRGGPDGDPKDELDVLTTLERVRALAHCRKWLYFEVRNVIMHRAHTLAYQKVAEEMLADGSMSEEDGFLLQDILDHLQYRGWERDQVVNLWQTLLMR
ncbi:uncharacterized protein KD926_001301 [Aspergillus affinis]|uniref:uncharacterized protein n=1 Tax=Aspergillus affinis TaxID=1070780 RepID=UPI0022FE7494|nr:uncharacterized protein KD926_001301 [Aspergillus affinis]KAI9036779.1 hypothetical protein KD926_001301 [Aspergillus affinis]